jgi:hypothetical protein
VLGSAGAILGQEVRRKRVRLAPESARVRPLLELPPVLRPRRCRRLVLSSGVGDRLRPPAHLSRATANVRQAGVDRHDSASSRRRALRTPGRRCPFSYRDRRVKSMPVARASACKDSPRSTRRRYRSRAQTGRPASSSGRRRTGLHASDTGRTNLDEGGHALACLALTTTQVGCWSPDAMGVSNDRTNDVKADSSRPHDDLCEEARSYGAARRYSRGVCGPLYTSCSLVAYLSTET